MHCTLYYTWYNTFYLGETVDWIDSNANKFVDDLDNIACAMIENTTESSDNENHDSDIDECTDDSENEYENDDKPQF